MEINLPVWGYYPPDNSYFVDPLYVPYQRELTPVCDPDATSCKSNSGNVCKDPEICEVNTWKQQGYPDALVHPELVRKAWGLSFQKMHPDKDVTCPEGWSPGEDGWCFENKPEWEGTFYTKDAFVPKYQYFGSYAPGLKNNYCTKKINHFDMKSVNPWTGNYTIYHNARPANNRENYGHLPSKDMMLA